MVDEVEETNSPRSLSDFLGDGSTVIQAFAPDFASIYDGYSLYAGRNVGVEGEDLSIVQCDSPSCRCRLRGQGSLGHGVQFASDLNTFMNSFDNIEPNEMSLVQIAGRRACRIIAPHSSGGVSNRVDGWLIAPYITVSNSCHRISAESQDLYIR